VDNAAIAFGWAAYKHMIKYVRADPDRYGIENARLKKFETLLVALDRQIFGAKLFESFLSQEFGLPGEGQGSKESAKALISGNRVLSEELIEVIKELYKRYTGGIVEGTVETCPRHSLVEVYGVYVLYRRLFRTTVKPDKKVFKEMWGLQKQVPLVLLYGRACWFIPDFLLKYAPVNVSGLSPSPQDVAIKKARVEFLEKFDDEYDKRIEDAYHSMASWMVRIESELVAGKSVNVAAVLNARSKLVLNGLLLANQIRTLVTVAIHLHLLLEVPFRASNIRALAVSCEILKAIELTYQRRISMIGDNISHMLSQTMFTLKRIFVPIRKKLDKKNRLDDTKLDVLAALQLALNLMDRAPTVQRQQVLHVALAVAQVKNMLRQNHSDEVRYQLWKLELLSGWQEYVAQVCNCDFLYWVSNLVPAFFTDIFKNADQVNRIPYLFAAFKDSSTLLEKALTNSDRFRKAYQAEVLSHFEKSIVDPLSREVETDLRLHIHSVVLSNQNLRNTVNKDLGRFLQLKPLVFFDTKIDLKARVTHYLDHTFYNLTAMTLHDWKIYAEMRNLAYEKYGLRLTEVHLPGSSHYSDALDILEIMRNIHIFVGRYNYNMNTQIFVEKAFDQKHLNTINIHHIAQSIRTHGTGIMNTTVNFTYQFLHRKFQLFSEFLYDDHIYSRLLRDKSWFKSEKDAIDSRYPYDRAEKFNKDIGKLGKLENGDTFLDQFRLQITEIGNALGYVRMVRSGGLHHLANAIKFIPSLEEIPGFAEKATAANLPESTQTAATNLDTVLDELSASFSEGTEYFQILVNIMALALQGESQKHLRNFYIIVPPLMLNYVDKMILLKERVNKKGGKAEASFTDDGFSLGLAYIIRLLDQDQDFDSLHWFESVRAYVEGKKVELANGAKRATRASEEDSQQFQLTTKRLEHSAKEFELLSYSFVGARIFFKASEQGEKPEGAGEQKADDQEGGGVEGAPAAPAMMPDVSGAPPPPMGAPPMAPPAPPM
jgi:WASH complex subunit 7